MIGDWLAQAPLFLLAVSALFLPGLVIGSVLRLRGLTLLAIAPPISVGALGLLAIVLGVLEVPWSTLSASVGIVAIAVLCYLIGFALRGRRVDIGYTSRPAHVLILVVGLLIGGGLNAARLMTYVGLPAAISQTNDAVFHLNALRWIAETGSASSFDLTGLIGASSFYPAAWHAVTSLVAVDLASIPIAANMVGLVIVSLIWPLGCALLARTISGGSRLVTAVAAAASGAFLAFPQLMFEWGVLYPYALSIAVLPSTIAAAFITLSTWSSSAIADSVRRTTRMLLVTLFALAAVALSQPASLLIWALLVLLWFSGVELRRFRCRSPRARGISVGILTLVWVAFIVVWLVLSYINGPVLWGPHRSPLGAMSDVVLNSHSHLPAAFVMSALVILGLFVAVRNKHDRWLAIAWAVIAALYVVSSAFSIPLLTRAMTGPWYGDSFRFTALTPLVAVPLVAIGAGAVIRRLTQIFSNHPTRTRVLAVVGALVIVAVVGVAGIITSPVILLHVGDERDRQSRYALDESSYLSIDELALLRRLPELVPEDALLIANPSTGAAFAYLIGDRDIVPRTWSPPSSEAWNLLAARMRDAGTDDAVCEALAAYGQPDYVLDFGPGGAGPGLYIMPGMTDFAGQPGFEEVASLDDASVWRITACG